MNKTLTPGTWNTQWTAFECFVFASYSKHLEIQAIMLNILSPLVDK